MKKQSSPTESAKLQQLALAFTAIPFNRMLGLQLGLIDHTQIVMTFEMKEELIGNYLHGNLHGGVISAVLDMAGGMLAMTNSLHQHQDKAADELIDIIGKTTTIDLQIQYLNPGRGKRFTAKSFLNKSGKRIVFTRMELINDEEMLIASGSASYLLK